MRMVDDGMPCALNAICSFEGKTIRSSARQHSLWVKGQEGVQHRERALAEAEPCAGRAKRAKDVPFVRRRLGRALLCDHLACDLGKRQRSPPKGRRWQDRFHSSSPSLRQKKSARRNGATP